MNKRWLPIIIIVVMAITLFLIRSHPPDRELQKQKPGNSKDPSSTVNRNHGFDRRTSYLQYSNHAKCRMSCRHITQSEVEEIMRDGKINYAKSDVKNARCPRYALEGLTSDNQKVRIVYAQCDESTTVVTVIDLKTDWSCDCPGDDKNNDR